MTMRVISGKAKGHKIRSLKGGGLRPTADRVRESLFARLGDRVEGARVLDLFAGSGALGIEALSRGAEHATFVENHRRAVEVIRQNLEDTKLIGNAKVVEASVRRFLAKPAKVAFDLVFMDPPYAEGVPRITLMMLNMGEHASSSTLMVLETATRYLPLDIPEGLRLVGEYPYGDTTLVFMMKEEV